MYKYVSVPLHREKDKDLINWLERLNDGQRSRIIREALREKKDANPDGELLAMLTAIKEDLEELKNRQFVMGPGGVAEETEPNDISDVLDNFGL